MVAATSQNDTLGITTKYASNSHYRELYKLLDTAQDLLSPDNHRTCNCSRQPVPDGDFIDIYRDDITKRTGYGGLMRCGSVWSCPVCASRISEERRVELQKAVNLWKARGKAVVMMTLTIQHNAGESCEAVLNRFRAAHRRITSGRWWQNFKEDIDLFGTVRALEVTRTEKNGWHVHAHVLMFLNLAPGQVYGGVEKNLKVRWTQCAAMAGGFATEEHGAKLDERDSYIAEYVAKFGRLPADMETAIERDGSGWTEAHEVAKAVSKKSKSESGDTPIELLKKASDGDTLAAHYWRQYVKAFHGMRQLVWSNGLKDELLSEEPEKSDEDTAEENTGEIVAQVDRDVWREIVRKRKRGELLDFASEYPGEIKEWIRDIEDRIDMRWQTVESVKDEKWRYVIQTNGETYRCAVYWYRSNNVGPVWRSNAPIRSHMEAFYLAIRCVNSLPKE